MKEKLGRKITVNWFVFINFLKEESSRSIDKLIDEDNYNIGFNLKTKLKKNIMIKQMT